MFGYISEKFRYEVVMEGGQLLETKCSHILFSLYCCYRNRQLSSLKLNGHGVTDNVKCSVIKIACSLKKMRYLVLARNTYSFFFFFIFWFFRKESELLINQGYSYAVI